MPGRPIYRSHRRDSGNPLTPPETLLRSSQLKFELFDEQPVRIPHPALEDCSPGQNRHRKKKTVPPKTAIPIVLAPKLFMLFFPFDCFTAHSPLTDGSSARPSSGWLVRGQRNLLSPYIVSFIGFLGARALTTLLKASGNGLINRRFSSIIESIRLKLSG